MAIAIIDSGLGLLPTAGWVRELCPEVDLLLATDPDGAPWGTRPERWVVSRVLEAVRVTVDEGAEVIVLSCNTATVAALGDVRRALGPAIPVVGTVPAIEPAAVECARFAVWATETTLGSVYLSGLIDRFGRGAEIVGVACHGLADAIDRGDLPAVAAAIGSAVERTPRDVEGVILGCTHYPLVRDAIASALPAGVRIFESSEAVARQTIRQIHTMGEPIIGSGLVRVLTSGRPGRLPAAAAAFASGRRFLTQPAPMLSVEM